MVRDKRLQQAALLAIHAQRAALKLHMAGELEYVADDPDCPDLLRLAALTEELGEIARCLHDNNTTELPQELAQLAGIALAWQTVYLENGAAEA